MKLKHLFASTGFLALLGLIGIFTDQRAFLTFFAFAVDFEYFFVKADEMWEMYMCRSAAKSFCLGMIAMAFTSLGTFIATGEGNESLVAGLAAGWAAAVAANAVLVAIYSFSASRALEE